MADESKENEELQAFAEALSALRPRAGQLDNGWRSLLAKGVSAAPCTEHLFLCMRCGAIGSAEDISSSVNLFPRKGSNRRWLWPAACAAATTVAALLLVTILIRPESRQEAEQGPPPATNAKVVVVSPLEQADEPIDPRPRELSRWATRTKQSGERVLAAGDAALPDDLLERCFSPSNSSSTGHKPASLDHLETADASLTNYAILQRLLKSTDRRGGASRAGVAKPFHATEEAL